MKYCKLSAAILAAFLSSALFGEIKMPKIFSDNMMLQRGMPVKIWGSAEPNADVKVSFGGREKSAKAGADGKWALHLDPMKPDGLPREMVVSENGKASKTIKNILVGEIWIAGGQSNMGFKVKESSDAEKAYARAKYPDLRYFDQSVAVSREPLADFSGAASWSAADGKNIAGYSAAAFYFAEKLREDLGVPVGIVYSARGATKMSCWIPKKDHAKSPELARYLAKFEKAAEGYDEAAYQKAVAAHKKLVEDVAAKRARYKNWWEKTPPNRTSPYCEFHMPYGHFNAMVAPMAGFTARGVIWYQGESDSYLEESRFFSEKFIALVDTWRGVFENPEMPFVWVQLTSYRTTRDWPTVRWHQLKVRDKIKNGAVANIIDVGENFEIHPRDKTTVGRRLEALALEMVYGVKGVKARAPEFKTAKYSGAGARVFFNSFKRGIAFKGEPRGFEVLANGKWSPAEASFEKESVAVKSKDGARVDGVRYLWNNVIDADICVYSRDGLPAFPFTDERK